MRRLALASALVLFTAPCALAAASDSSITIIQDDGSKVVIELEPADPVLPGPAAGEPPPAPEPAPEPEPAPPVEKKPVHKDIAPKPYVDEIVTPAAPESDAAPVKETPKKSKAKKDAPKKESKKKKKSSEKNGGKSAKKAKPEKGAYEFVIPPGAVITENLAASIAMDSAPPSSGYVVSRQQYKGKDAFVVTFRTEDGPYDVLVDSVTGEILVSAYVETHEVKPTAPGHLPQDWEPYNPQPRNAPAKKP